MRISDWSSDVCSSDLRGSGVGRLHPKTTDNLLGQVLDLAPLNQAATDQSLLEGAEQGVIRQAQLRHGAVAQAFGWNKCQPEAATGIGAQMRHRLPVEPDRLAFVAGELRFTAEECQPLILPITRDSGETDDFAAS